MSCFTYPYVSVFNHLIAVKLNKIIIMQRITLVTLGLGEEEEPMLSAK